MNAFLIFTIFVSCIGGTVIDVLNGKWDGDNIVYKDFYPNIKGNVIDVTTSQQEVDSEISQTIEIPKFNQGTLLTFSLEYRLQNFDFTNNYIIKSQVGLGDKWESLPTIKMGEWGTWTSNTTVSEFYENSTFRMKFEGREMLYGKAVRVTIKKITLFYDKTEVIIVGFVAIILSIITLVFFTTLLIVFYEIISKRPGLISSNSLY